MYQGSNIKVTSCKALVKSHFLPSKAHTHNRGNFRKPSMPSTLSHLLRGSQGGV